ncbi:MAG: HIT family protein [Erysipelotrichaceae bacterium]|nr:HIT family protein [Erysipelotrichaceae bacterium]MDO5122724.1 HIT family protein [Erysipelotrichaceae bacterium]
MCVFCEIIAGNIPSSKVYEDDEVLAILDLSQVTRGHTLVMPKKHYANILEADEETTAACMKVVSRLSRQIVKNTGAVGLNVLNNCGAIAGQSVDHLHFHIIPRYSENDAVSFAFHESEKQDLSEVLAEITK